jgi:hypothetical protein
MWDTFLMEAGGARAIDSRNSLSISLFKSVLELTVDDSLELIVLWLWITIDCLVRNNSCESVNRFLDIFKLDEFLLLGSDLAQVLLSKL